MNLLYDKNSSTSDAIAVNSIGYVDISLASFARGFKYRYENINAINENIVNINIPVLRKVDCFGATD
jgi:hypothetical protein